MSKQRSFECPLYSAGVWSQLGTILAHIEDLEVVRDRVSTSDNTSGYNVPLATEINNCV